MGRKSQHKAKRSGPSVGAQRREQARRDAAAARQRVQAAELAERERLARACGAGDGRRCKMVDELLFLGHVLPICRAASLSRCAWGPPPVVEPAQRRETVEQAQRRIVPRNGMRSLLALAALGILAAPPPPPPPPKYEP